MNEERLREAIYKLAQYRPGGDIEIMAELFYSMFADLPETKQESYIKTLQDEIKNHQEFVNNIKYKSR